MSDITDHSNVMLNVHSKRKELRMVESSLNFFYSTAIMLVAGVLLASLMIDKLVLKKTEAFESNS